MISKESVINFTQFISMKVEKILGKSQAQFREKLRKLRLWRNDGCLIKKHRVKPLGVDYFISDSVLDIQSETNPIEKQLFQSNPIRNKPFCSEIRMDYIGVRSSLHTSNERILSSKQSSEILGLLICRHCHHHQLLALH